MQMEMSQLLCCPPHPFLLPALFLQDGKGLELTSVLLFEVLGEQNSYLSVPWRLTTNGLSEKKLTNDKLDVFTALNLFHLTLICTV